MSDSLLAILHPVHAPIGELEAKVALSDADRLRYSGAISLDSLSLTRDETLHLDWVGAQRALAREYEERIAQTARAGARFAYFGLAPIPLAMQLGYLLEEWPSIDVYQRRHDGSNAWSWASVAPSVQVRVHRTHDVFPITVAGDVVIRISTWHPIDSIATRSVLAAGVLLEVDITLEQPGPDAIASPADVSAIAETFRTELDAISDAMPSSVIHVFAAVPVGLALELGRKVSPTKHRPIQTYQFHARETPSHRPALVLQDVRSTAVRSLAPADIEKATAACSTWNEELERLSALARSARADEPTWADAIGLAISDAWRELPDLARLAPVLTGASVDPLRAEFVFDRERGIWALSPDLVLAVNQAIPSEQLRRLAIRLFFQHEGLHHEWHGLAARTSAGVGRRPRVLEEADYQADVWAMLQELSRAAPREDQDALVRLARDMVETALGMFWAFDSGDGPMHEIQVRRLNRYLIWYWQALRLEHVETLADVVAVLTRKPTLEIAGLQARVTGERVVYRLGSVPEHLEVGVFANDIIERRPDGRAYSVREVVNGFRNRDKRAIKEALRGVFENVYARGIDRSRADKR